MNLIAMNEMRHYLIFLPLKSVFTWVEKFTISLSRLRYLIVCVPTEVFAQRSCHFVMFYYSIPTLHIKIKNQIKMFCFRTNSILDFNEV